MKQGTTQRAKQHSGSLKGSKNAVGTTVKLSASIVRSIHEIHASVSLDNIIDPYSFVVEKLQPLHHYLFETKYGKQYDFAEIKHSIRKFQFSDLVQGKNIDIHQAMLNDDGFVIMLYITEWFRLWVAYQGKHLKESQFNMILEYLNQYTREELINSNLIDSLIEFNRDSFKLYIALALYV